MEDFMNNFLKRTSGRLVSLLFLTGFIISCPDAGTNTVSVTSVTLNNKDTTEVTMGGALQLSVTVEPADATDKTVTWSSSDENIATVDSSGVVTPVKESSNPVTITVTSQGDSSIKDTIDITVKAKAVNGKIDLSTLTPGYPATLSMLTGATTGNTASPTWSVPDTDVIYSITASPSGATQDRVTIDGNTGVVTVGTDAVGAESGDYTITATAEATSADYKNSVTATFTLTINAVPGSPSITSATPTDAGDIDLVWTLPTDTGYSGTTPEALTALEITISPAPTSGGATRSVGAAATTETITGLDPGKAYTFTMTASNTHGKSTASAEKSATTKSDLSTATLSYGNTLTRTFGTAGIDSGTPSWTGGAGTPVSPTYSIAQATTGAPTADGTALSSDGISISTDGVITVGTAVEVKHSGNYLVTVTAAAGDANYITGSATTLTVAVTVNQAAVTGLSGYSDITATVNTPISAQTGSTTPTGATGSYSLSPSLPAGLNIASDTGIISGTPTAVTASAQYTVTFTADGNYTGTPTEVITIAVNAKAINSIGYGTITGPVGQEITAVTPTVVPSGATGTFAVTVGNLPAGLSLDEDTGGISGTPTAVTSGAVLVTIKMTGTGDYKNKTATGQVSITIEANSVPKAPNNISFSTWTENSIDLSWTAPSDTGYNGGNPATITSYKVYSSKTNDFTNLASLQPVDAGTSTSATVNNLDSGSQYFFAVTATNAVGEGAVSQSSATYTNAKPGAPTGPSVTPGNEKVTISWTAPVDRGYSNGVAASITGYSVYYSQSQGFDKATAAGQKSAGTAVSIDVDGLTNGIEYYFLVTAINNVGEGGVSSEVNAKPQASLAEAGFTISVANLTVWQFLSSTHSATIGGGLTAGTDYSLTLTGPTGNTGVVSIDNSGTITTPKTGTSPSISLSDEGLYTITATGEGAYKGTETTTFTLDVKEELTNSLPDSSFTASSTFRPGTDKETPAHSGRGNFQQLGWSSATGQAGDIWWQVDLGSDKTFNAIAVRAGHNLQYPTEIVLQYSSDNSSWTDYSSTFKTGFVDNNALKIFKDTLTSSLTARYVRFKIVSHGGANSKSAFGVFSD